MDERGCRRLIGSLVESDLASRGLFPSFRQLPPASLEVLGPDYPQESDGVEVEQATSPLPSTSRSNSERLVEIESPALVRQKPASLQLEEVEVAAMKDLAALVGRSPREVKRFLNVYRIVKAAIPPDEVSSFIGTNVKRGEFRFPMLLLALVSGMPQLASLLLLELSGLGRQNDTGRGGGTLGELLSVTALSTFSATDLNRLREFLVHKKAWDLETHALGKWAGRVSQFTFERVVQR